MPRTTTRRTAGPRASVLLIGLAAMLLTGCAGLLGAQPTPEPVVVIITATPARATAAPPPTQAPTADPEADPTATSVPLGTTPEPAAAAPLLQRVQERGRLVCGTNADLPGFGSYDDVRKRWSGFDVDFCRALAAAIFGDANAVEYIGLATSDANPQIPERFNAVREGLVDVLIRNTTWTLGRDLSQLAFGPTTFHDGQTFMVRSDAGIQTVDDLEGKRICVAAGTTSEQNLRDDFAARGITFEIVTFGDEQLLYPAYDRGDCDAVTSDSSQLVAERLALSSPDEHTVLGDRISREPLGPVFIENDEQWRDIVSWVIFATIYAEELRVDRSNVEQLQASSDDPRVRRLLGVEGDFGERLGLPSDFAYQVIRQVGNYGDIYERNLGPDTPFELDRGPNKVWNLGAGGVLASPPFR